MDDDEDIHIIEITAEELKKLLESPNPPLVLDVREPMELMIDGRIEGSTHIPMMQIPYRLEDLPRDRKIVAQCAHGQRSYNVAAYLLMNGFEDVVNLDGGIVAWNAMKS